LTELIASESTPVYSTVQAPALAVYHIPQRVEDVIGGETVLSEACISALQQYIYGSIAGFAVGVKRARIVGLSDTQHVIHLVSPDTLEVVMRHWLATLPEWR
jgi:hypothetical protein